MLFRVAMALGRTVGELEETIGHAELLEWFAFYELEPWGAHIEDFRAALGPWVAARIAAGRKGRSVRLEDFMRRRAEHRRMATAEDILGALGVAPPWAAKSTSS